MEDTNDAMEITPLQKAAERIPPPDKATPTGPFCYYFKIADNFFYL